MADGKTASSPMGARASWPPLTYWVQAVKVTTLSILKYKICSNSPTAFSVVALSTNRLNLSKRLFTSLKRGLLIFPDCIHVSPKQCSVIKTVRNVNKHLLEIQRASIQPMLTATDFTNSDHWTTLNIESTKMLDLLSWPSQHWVNLSIFADIVFLC